MDNYQAVRSLPFPVICQALGLDVTKYKVRKNGEYYGACPIHGPKTNHTSFSYNADGRFNCFSCNAKGRGAIDLVKLARGIGFQDAVSLLEGINYQPNTKTAPEIVSDIQATAQRVSLLSARL